VAKRPLTPLTARGFSGLTAGERLVDLDDARGGARDHAQGVVDADELWRRLATLGRKQRSVFTRRHRVVPTAADRRHVRPSTVRVGAISERGRWCEVPDRGDLPAGQTYGQRPSKTGYESSVIAGFVTSWPSAARALLTALRRRHLSIRHPLAPTSQRRWLSPCGVESGRSTASLVLPQLGGTIGASWGVQVTARRTDLPTRVPHVANKECRTSTYQIST